MSSRTNKWLEKQTFTNSDLLDILYISDNKEYHSDKRSFHQRLIKSQKGPFSAEVFRVFAENLFEVDSMLHLLENSPTTSPEARLRWFDYTMVSAAHWFTFNFYSKDSGNVYGIDITKSPYNKEYAGHIVKYADKMGRGNVHEGYFTELHRALDSMTDSEIYQWYLDSVASTYAERAVDFIMSYDKMPENVIQHYFEKSVLQNREKLALHPNCPADLREFMYQETKDEKYLPQAAKDLFLF
jgi:hypothetical protein